MILHNRLLFTLTACGMFVVNYSTNDQGCCYITDLISRQK